ncbi:MAG TPA: methyltransferase [Bryobacteraceae bacterium]|jgi:precorrin-6B methylase 2|nr:methyltransferase [Bryobacteraceae bacterium]
MMTPERILQLGLGFWGAKTLLTAVELNLFTLLETGPLDAAAIGEKLFLNGRGDRDFLDALVALGMLEREDGLYRNVPEAAVFLDRKKPSYIGGLLEMANARLYPSWGSLTEALKTGRPQNPESDSTFETLYSDPARLRQFVSAMTGVSMGSAKALAAKFPWNDYRTFVDVGCAQGCVPVQVSLANPHLRGTGFDLQQVGPIFTEYVAGFHLSERVGFQPGSFFTDALPSADVIVMGHILHDWNLETKKMLLRKAHEALPDGGSLIVYEALIDDDRRQNAFGLLMSLNMLVETEGGFDYTGADCKEWMREAGFRETRVEHLNGPDSMVIAIK